MTFPAYALQPVAVTGAMTDAVGIRPQAAWLGRDLICLLDNEAEVRAAQPEAARLQQLDGLLLHLTAPGSAPYDCVSRSFAPKLGVYEDPVCGSGHCHIAPLWHERLGKTELTAYQASRRGGTLHCRIDGDRVILAGSAVLYAIADLYL